eukprot:7579783-Lingulodinium_polyedra.AAC.1
MVPPASRWWRPAPARLAGRRRVGAGDAPSKWLAPPGPSGPPASGTGRLLPGSLTESELNLR